MSTVRLSDVIQPVEFSAYVAQNTAVKSALVQSGIMARNNAIEAQLKAGADSFTIPAWLDLSDDEASIVSDDPDQLSTPGKVGTTKQRVRKAYLAKSWAAMNMASELSGSNAMAHIQNRVTAYWERQLQARLVASLQGIIADNEASDSSDMLNDISEEADEAAKLTAEALIDTVGTLGDSMSSVVALCCHSDVFRYLLKLDAIEYLPPSEGSLSLPTWRGLAVVYDDAMPEEAGVYTTALFGQGAVAYGVTAPRIADGTEVESLPASGNGGGQQVLHSRQNLAVAPAGFSFDDTATTGDSPSIAELRDAQSWKRTAEDRRNVPMAFLRHKI
ncbi:hypothetical protein P1P91_10915 [Halomonas piscis]|uniref:Phage coat protein n=1 Tax=Halomonas piscis TaxID=3031727 RepID=A0ABY9YZA0_9GAMM|nr:hypothetical protein [Halomonas piscis]WNK19363.1 hypothetical protein P1P91_10915 [Halomonas piscis]